MATTRGRMGMSGNNASGVVFGGNPSATNATEEWTNEIVNVYADMEISDVSISGNKISFKAGLSGMDDTTGDDIKLKIDEYATMSDVEIKNISC